MEGIIIKALSGFYYVKSGSQTYSCRAKGRFRLVGQSPLVGDRVQFEPIDEQNGTVTQLLERKNFFFRPAIANIDMLVMIASASIPVTDPFLIDRMTVRCEKNHCDAMVVINKCDLTPGDKLCGIYSSTKYTPLCVSAVTGEGVEQLREAIRGKVCCFTGNSGVGKSSLLNALNPQFSVKTAEVSEKLGRGKHTTRHVELFDLGHSTYVADTPGFAAFDASEEDPIHKTELANLFPEFLSYTDDCRFLDCRHLSEPHCAVREAAEQGRIHPSRYRSYCMLYEEAARRKDWEIK